MKNRITKSIVYSYPTSENAKKLGFADSGCWHISETIHNIEGSGQARTYVPHDAQGFRTPDNPDLISLYIETRGIACQYFKKYGNKLALKAIQERSPV